MLLRALVVLVASNVVKPYYCTAALGAKMGKISVDFEIFGKVQGVFFRKLPEHSVPGLHEPQPHLYNLISVDFEVYGKVHGNNFLEYTKEQADKLGVRGWCKNTPRGTVQGQLEGSEDNIQSMMNWLKTKGSPASEIERAEFRNQQDILDLNFNDFSIRRD